ncbi:MAG: chemotaxis response regulator protein-glutamate methylesterase [Robiginitomaculum sp.]|nr:MAG: chemotaxis response regulator protein-glutamate methylesterase [Robiginitomaculum sp.]
MERVRVLIVDDSPTMRAVVKAVLRSDPLIEVVGEAEDPYVAREEIKRLNPDVLTLDIEMPRMSGLEFLAKIMKLRPMPVVMCSTLTQAGAKDSIEALSMGAFECVGKPTSGDFVKALAHLPAIVKAAAKYKPQGMGSYTQAHSGPKFEQFSPNRNVLCIGSSTGGVEALGKMLADFPKNCPPTLITQHMPEAFLKSFAQRLDGIVAPNVKVANDGEAIRPGNVYFAPGGLYHMEVKGRVTPICQMLEGDIVSGHRPSVDVMMHSVAQIYGKRTVGVMLTGMGRDGAEGLLAIRQSGGHTIGQDENSSTVYGMARVAKSLGAVKTELPLSKIAAEIMRVCDANISVEKLG